MSLNSYRLFFEEFFPEFIFVIFCKDKKWTKSSLYLCVTYDIRNAFLNKLIMNWTYREGNSIFRFKKIFYEMTNIFVFCGRKEKRMIFSRNLTEIFFVIFMQDNKNLSFFQWEDWRFFCGNFFLFTFCCVPLTTNEWVREGINITIFLAYRSKVHECRVDITSGYFRKLSS